MLKGRLGLETSRVPHADRHGLMWLERGELGVREAARVFRKKAVISAMIDRVKQVLRLDEKSEEGDGAGRGGDA